MPRHTQSGAFGVVTLDFLAERQIGNSKFVSFGSKCDVTVSKMMYCLLCCRATKVLLLYVEEIKYGRQFLKIAKKITLKEPMEALKAGESSAGAIKALVSYDAYSKKNNCREKCIRDFLRKKIPCKKSKGLS